MSNEPLSIFDQESDDDRTPVVTRKRRRPVVIVLSVLLVLLVGIGAAGGYYAWSVMNGLNQIERAPGLLPTRTPTTPGSGGTGSPAPEPVANNSLNFVLIGSDTRGDERGRSDVLQLLHLSGSRDAAYLVSLPRDSWVDIPGHGKGKINWAYSFGGAALTVETLEQLLGVQMDHVVIIDFEGFSQVINSLGGVTVYNRYSTSSRGFDFPKGEISLDGDAALAFVRERYTIPGGDFGRAERQRDVIKAIVKKLASAGTLADPIKFRNAVSSLGAQFVVDESLTNDAIVSLGMESGAAFDNISSMGLPNKGVGREGTQSIVRVDWDAVEELKAALRNDTMSEFYAKHNG